MEEPTKYEVKKDHMRNNELPGIIQAFEEISRQYGQFLAGDIVLTDDKRLQQVGSELSADRAKELLESHSLRAFYPVESQIELK